MIAVAIVLSIIFVFLSAKFPRCVVYTGIIFTFVLYLTLIVLGIIIGVWALVIVVALVALINACVLWCWRDKLKVGIALLGASGEFMI